MKKNENKQFPVIFNFTDTGGNKVFVAVSEFQSFEIHPNGYGIFRVKPDRIFLVAKEEIDRVQAKIGFFESIAHNEIIKPLMKINN